MGSGLIFVSCVSIHHDDTYHIPDDLMYSHTFNKSGRSANHYWANRRVVFLVCTLPSHFVVVVLTHSWYYSWLVTVSSSVVSLLVVFGGEARKLMMTEQGSHLILNLRIYFSRAGVGESTMATVIPDFVIHGRETLGDDLEYP